MASIATCHKPESSNPEALLGLAESLDVALTVVGPEAPLVAGAVDRFRQAGRLIIGPTAAAARLEGSKLFAKQAMQRFGVPTARYEAVEDYAAAVSALGRFSYPVVLKADGLAAGKGVLIVQDRQEAEEALRSLLSGALVGGAGSRVVIEEYLSGEEVSFIALSDGEHVLPLAPTQDHKAIFDGDKGPNTGGMGAYCDARILTPAQASEVMERVMLPVVNGMRRDGCPFSGFLYAGLMMTDAGPKVLEFNVRLGDPEAQPLMLSLDSDLAPVLMAAARGELAAVSLDWQGCPSVCVVLASEGYPGPPRTGDLISGIDEAESSGALVFHAGTKHTPEGLVSAGGRVLGVTASGPDLPSAIARTYQAVGRIRFRGMQFRRDIGQKGLRRWPAAQ